MKDNINKATKAFQRKINVQWKIKFMILLKGKDIPTNPAVLSITRTYRFYYNSSYRMWSSTMIAIKPVLVTKKPWCLLALHMHVHVHLKSQAHNFGFPSRFRSAISQYKFMLSQLKVPFISAAMQDLK